MTLGMRRLNKRGCYMSKTKWFRVQDEIRPGQKGLEAEAKTNVECYNTAATRG